MKMKLNIWFYKSAASHGSKWLQKKSWNLQFCFISSLLYFWYLALQHSASPLVSAQKGLRLMTKAITDLTLSLSLSHRDEWPFTSSHTYHCDNCAYQAKNNLSVWVSMWGHFWRFLTQGRSVMDRCWESTSTCIMSRSKKNFII